MGEADEILVEVKRIWQPGLMEPVLDEDAREIHQNIAGVVSVLNQWQQCMLPSLDEPPMSPDGPMGSPG